MSVYNAVCIGLIVTSHKQSLKKKYISFGKMWFPVWVGVRIVFNTTTQEGNDLMKKRWIGCLVTFIFAFIITGCGSQGTTGQVESLSPEEMKEYIQNNDTAYVLINSTEDEEERKANIKFVGENIDDINVKEINSQSPEMLDNNLELKDLGLKNIQFETLGLYENGILKQYVSLRSVDFPSEDEKEKAIQKFIEITAS